LGDPTGSCSGPIRKPSSSGIRGMYFDPSPLGKLAY
jgi:hypothetical protein